MRKNLEFICYFAIAFSGYLWISAPTNVPAAIIFRLFLLVGGLIGIVLLKVSKNKQEKKD